MTKPCHNKTAPLPKILSPKTSKKQIWQSIFILKPATEKSPTKSTCLPFFILPMARHHLFKDSQGLWPLTSCSTGRHRIAVARGTGRLARLPGERGARSVFFFFSGKTGFSLFFFFFGGGGEMFFESSSIGGKIKKGTSKVEIHMYLYVV